MLLDQKKNLESKTLLCERAEELIVETSITKAFKELQNLREQWREIGPVPVEQNDEIWARFRNAALTHITAAHGVQEHAYITLGGIEQYVQQNMNRGTINLEDMASAMGMSMKPLFQKVREITGRTPAEVVRDLRLKHACILLQRTNINMSELANHVGFATGEHFINVFKERFGMSPSEYRLKYRR